MQKDKKYLEYTYSDHFAPPSSYPDYLARYLLDNVYERPGKLCDFGCGRGDYLDAFSKIGFQVKGLDIAPELAADLGFHVRHINFSNEKSGLRTDYIRAHDFVFSKSVIEHLHDPDIYLNNIYKALKIGGKGVIMTPSWEHTYMGPFYVDHTHVQPYTKRSLQSVLEMAGFENVKVSYFYQLPFTWKFPFLLPFVKIFRTFPIPYAPNHDVPWGVSNWFNKLVRFSREPMLIATFEKRSITI